MRRDTHDLHITNIDWLDTGDAPAQPMLTVQYAGSPARLKDRLTKSDSTLLDAAEIDVTFRGQSPESETDTQGMLAVSNNVTGDFVLELPTGATPIHDFVHAVRQYVNVTGSDIACAIQLSTDEGVVVTYEKQIFLVYDPNGTLLRRYSLIPDGVEI